MMSYQISTSDDLRINWSSIDSHLIDMLTPALNPDTYLTLYNCNSLTEADVEVLENLFQLMDRVDIKTIGKKFSGLRSPFFIEDYSKLACLDIYALNKSDIGAFDDLNLILRLINSFSWSINKNKAIIAIWNAKFQDFQLFSIAKGNMNYIIELENWLIKLPRNKHKLNYWGQFINFTNWFFEWGSMQIWYRQLLKILGENNYFKIYRLKNFFILRNNSDSINMLDYLWNKINKRNLIYNLLVLEIIELIKDIEKLNFSLQQKGHSFDIIQYIKFF